jgi:hypothetical protein
MKTKVPSRISPQREHNKYGIQNWLRNNGFCTSEVGKLNETEYIKLIDEFCVANGFRNLETAKLSSKESYVSNRFHDFTKFTRKQFPETNNN